MNCNYILSEFRKRHERKTQAEIAKETHISQSYICDLLSGKRSFENVTLEKIKKIFPDAEISLSGKNVIQTNSNSVNCNNSVVVKSENAVDKILESDLEDSIKIRVIKILRG